MADFEDEDEPEEKPFDRSVFRRLIGYIRPFGWIVAAVTDLVLLVSGVATLSPLFAKIAIDRYIVPGNLHGLDLLVLGWVGLLAAGWAWSYGRTYLLGLLGQKVVFTMCRDLFSHLLRLSFDYHDAVPVGKSVTRVTSDVDTISDLVSNGLVNFIGEGATLAGVVIVMLLLDLRLALVTFVTLPLLVYLFTAFRAKITKAERGLRLQVSELNAFVQENLSGIRAVQAFNRQKTNAAVFESRSNGIFTAAMRTVALFSLFWPSLDFVSILGTIVVVCYGSILLASGQTSLGVLVAFMSYVGQFFGPVRNIAQAYRMLQRAMAGGERIFRVLDIPEHVRDAEGAAELPRIKGDVSLRGVYFAYEDDDFVLNGVDLEARAGETVALVGQTGAGKTSIINLLPRFYDAQRGEVRIDGVDIRQVTLASLRSQIGIVLQEPFLFAGTVRENIAYAKPEATDEEVVNVCRQLGLHDFIMKLPGGYGTAVEERGSRLSTGQRQLVSFARALMADPRILIMDEATANIDSQAEQVIRQALKTLLQGRTAFIVAYRFSSVREADKIVVIEGGRIAESGTHDELLRLGGIYGDLYKASLLGVTAG